jgi:hypothetical protein
MLIYIGKFDGLGLLFVMLLFHINDLNVLIRVAS